MQIFKIQTGSGTKPDGLLAFARQLGRRDRLAGHWGERVKATPRLQIASQSGNAGGWVSGSLLLGLACGSSNAASLVSPGPQTARRKP